MYLLSNKYIYIQDSIYVRLYIYTSRRSLYIRSLPIYSF